MSYNILVLHISLDIRHLTLKFQIFLTQKFNKIHDIQKSFQKCYLNSTCEFGYQTSKPFKFGISLRQKLIVFITYKYRVLERLFQFYNSVWISNIQTIKIWKTQRKKSQVVFILQRNRVLETIFQFLYEFGYQTSTFKTKIQSCSCYLDIMS